MLGQLFDDRYAGVRMALLALGGAGYLAFRSAPNDRLTTADWALDGAALVLCGAVARWPLPGSVALALLLALADRPATVTPVVVMVAASFAVLEVAVRRPARPDGVAAAAALCAAYVVPNLEDWPAALPTQLFTMATLVGFPLLLGANIRSGRQLVAQAERSVAAERRERLAALTAARAAERAAVARELHDVVAHHVASIVLRVGVARHVLGHRDPQVDEVLDDVHATGSIALADLRGLVVVLRDPDAAGTHPSTVTVETGSLPGALAATLDRARVTGVQVEADLDPRVAEVDPIRALALLRLTQEALTNVARHAGPPARAHLTVAVDDDGAIRWEVTDDGGPAGGTAGGSARGAAIPPGGGHGLTGMRERVALLGGSLDAGPLPAARGWRVATLLPPAAAAPGVAASGAVTP